MPINGDAPDLTLLHEAIPADTDCGKLIRDQAVAACLAPVFVTRMNRTAIPIHLASEDEIEVAVDEGTIEAKTGSVSLAAVELELKQGNRQALHATALELLKAAPLRIDHRSKADVGYELLVAEHAEAVRAKPVRLGKSASIEDAFCTILRNCLDQVHANARGSFPVTIRHACIRCGWDSGVCVRRWTCSPRCFPHTPDSTPNCAGLRQNSVRRAIGEYGRGHARSCRS